MKKIYCVLVMAVIASFHCYSQFKLSPADSIRRDSINRVTQQDYKKMLDQLNIDFNKTRAVGKSICIQMLQILMNQKLPLYHFS